jgi:hypothetical protein
MTVLKYKRTIAAVGPGEHVSKVFGEHKGFKAVKLSDAPLFIPLAYAHLVFSETKANGQTTGKDYLLSVNVCYVPSVDSYALRTTNSLSREVSIVFKQLPIQLKNEIIENIFSQIREVLTNSEGKLFFPVKTAEEYYSFPVTCQDASVSERVRLLTLNAYKELFFKERKADCKAGNAAIEGTDILDQFQGSCEKIASIVIPEEVKDMSELGLTELKPSNTGL